MNILATTLGATLALAIHATPTRAEAQEAVPYTYGYGYEEPSDAYETSTSTVNIAPPSYASVFVYEGHRLLSRFDGPGALFLPSGHVYRIMAMRGDQVVWSGNVSTTGATIDLRWAPRNAPRRGPGWGYGPGQYGYGSQWQAPQRPIQPLSPPIEYGRERTPLP